jgi:hypothetical protein
MCHRDEPEKIVGRDQPDIFIPHGFHPKLQFPLVIEDRGCGQDFGLLILQEALNDFFACKG